MKISRCFQLLLLTNLVLSLSCTLTSAPTTAPITPTSELVLTKFTTVLPTITTPTHAYTMPCRILYVKENEGYDIFVRNCDGSNARQLTEGRIYGKAMSWSPDGQHIIFDVLYPGIESEYSEIYIMETDGANRTRLIGPGSFYLPSWSPDGEQIVFMDGCNIKTMRPDGLDIVLIMEGSEIMMYAGDPVMCPFTPAWSPDSSQIVFYADDLNAFNSESLGPYLHRIAVVNADGTGLHSLVDFTYPLPNSGVSDAPCWSPDGQQVAYTLFDSKNGTVTSFLVNADGSGEPVEIDSVPDSWHPWYWPQWSR